MRRLTLILSDLYLPEDSAGAMSAAALELPNLEGLLRFARTREWTGDWRRWLARELDLPQLEDIPPAQVAARGLLPDELAQRAWFATPVFFDLHINHVRMNPRGLLRVPPDEGSAWCDAFARDFGADYTLHYAGARGFFITGLAPGPARTLDPARLLGGDVAAGLRRPGDRAGIELARTATEIEFWLHASPLNLARERSRMPRITSLWLWGGGVPGTETIAAGAKPATQPAIFAADPWLAGLARTLGSTATAIPPAFETLPSATEHAIVELMPMSGAADESLGRLDAAWIAPSRLALAGGALDRIDLLANDRHWCIPRGNRWRFWRRRTGWLESLGLPPAATKA